MYDIKSRVQNLDPNVSARSFKKLTEESGNIYKSLVIISKRAQTLNNELKQELNSKLEEFASTSDTIEEVMENKEQIEISKFYERLPNPVIIATNEFLDGDLVYKEDKEEAQHYE